MQENDKRKGKLELKTVLIWVIILVLVPVTGITGMLFLESRKYYITSLFIVLLTIIAFFLSFEKRKPGARELSILAVLCAIGVLGRAFFFMLPQMKPVAAVVILTAVCFGPASGFLVGAVTALLSNIFFGQGPLTPWQMFSFGIIGFLAGVLFQKGILPTKKLPLCIYGGVSVFVIYGGIMNLTAVLVGVPVVNWGIILAAYVQGVPYDLLHAAATVIFLMIFAKPMIEKLERMKTKYGLLL